MLAAPQCACELSLMPALAYTRCAIADRAYSGALMFLRSLAVLALTFSLSSQSVAAPSSVDETPIVAARLAYFGSKSGSVCKSRGAWIQSSHCYRDGACCQNGNACRNAYETLCEFVTCAGGAWVKYYCDQDPD
jgi:hypothetical protein